MNAASGRLAGAKTLPPAAVAELSVDGRWLALASGTRVSVVEAATGQERGSASTPAEVRTLAIAAGAAQLVAVTDKERLHAWQGTSMEQPASAEPPDPLALGFEAINPRQFFTMTHEPTTRVGDRQTLRWWALPSMASVGAVMVGQDAVNFKALCAVTHDGSRIAITNRGLGIVIQETESDRALGVVDEADASGSCAFSVDGRYLAIWGVGIVVVWDITTQAAVARIGSATPIETVAFSPGNRYLAVLADDGTVSISSLRPRDLIAQACTRLGANISVEDWDRYVGQEPRSFACPQLEPTER